MQRVMEYDERYYELSSKYGQLLVTAQKKREEIRPFEELGFREGFIITEEGYVSTPSSGVNLTQLHDELDSLEDECREAMHELQRHIIMLKNNTE